MPYQRVAGVTPDGVLKKVKFPGTRHIDDLRLFFAVPHAITLVDDELADLPVALEATRRIADCVLYAGRLVFIVSDRFLLRDRTHHPMAYDRFQSAWVVFGVSEPCVICA